MKRFLSLLLLIPLPILAQSPGTGLDSLPLANALGGGELMFSYQAGSGGSGVTACARGWCPVDITPALLKAFGMAATTNSLQGSGALSAPVQLVNDTASPGNSMLYGTNASGIKGWFAQASGGVTGFNTITSGLNTVGTSMLVGNGAMLGPTGSGVVNANQFNAAAAPVSASVIGTNGSGQLVLTPLVSGANGGNGVNNGSFTNTFAGNVNFGGAFSTTQSGAVSSVYTATTTATYPVGTYSVGYLGCPVNSQGGAYTLYYSSTTSDAGKCVLNTDTSANTFTIPANGGSNGAFPVSSCVVIMNAPTGGTLTIAITTDTLYWLPTLATGSRTMAAGGVATICKIYGTTSWAMVSSAGVT